MEGINNKVEGFVMLLKTSLINACKKKELFNLFSDRCLAKPPCAEYVCQYLPAEMCAHNKILLFKLKLYPVGL